MDTKSKVLLWIFLILILASGAFIYYKYLVLKDFEVIELTDIVTEQQDGASFIEE